MSGVSVGASSVLDTVRTLLVRLKRKRAVNPVLPPSACACEIGLAAPSRSQSDARLRSTGSHAWSATLA